MLANILNSERAIQASIRIVEIYIKLREHMLTNNDLLLKMEQFEKRMGKQDEKIALVFESLKKFIDVQEKPRRVIGFKREEERQSHKTKSPPLSSSRFSDVII